MAVTGIGGLFFRCKDPKAQAAWYLEHLSVGAPEGVFVWPQQAGPTVFAPFKADSDYFPAEKQWMINFRVDDLDGLMASLKAAGIEVITKPEWDVMPEVGRFARISDPEGNQIELWQPGTPAA